MLNIINILYVYFLLKYTRIYERKRRYCYDNWSEWKKINNDGKIRLKIITLILISIYFIFIFFFPVLQLITLILLILFNFIYLIEFNPYIFSYTEEKFERKFTLEEKYLNRLYKFLNKKISF